MKALAWECLAGLCMTSTIVLPQTCGSTEPTVATSITMESRL